MARLNFNKGEADRPVAMSLVPMIDVVLQIICFYIFVAGGVQASDDPRVELPRMTSEALAEELPAELILNLDAQGVVTASGSTVEMRNLPAYLKREVERAAAGGQHLRVAVRADRRQQFDVLDRVLQACRQAEIDTVSVRATSGGGGDNAAEGAQ